MFSFEFTYPFAFALFPIVFGIWFFFFREKIGLKAPNPLIEKYLRYPVWFFILWIFRGLIVFMGIVLIANPSKEITLTEAIEEKDSILIILDISRSMLAEDISPNRIESAKKVIDTFIDKRDSSQFGLIVFAGKPFLSIPFSSDRVWIKSVIKNITPATLEQSLPGLSGTAIGDALLLGQMSFSGQTDGKKSIILITDGKWNAWIDPRTLQKQENITTYTIGIWWYSSGELFYTEKLTGEKVFLYDESWAVLKSDIDEELLSSIAAEWGGFYYRASDASNLEKHFESIESTMDQRVTEEVKTRIKNFQFESFLLLIFLFSCERTIFFFLKKKYKIK